MAGTFDPNQAQNLAEVRPVSKGQRPEMAANGFVCCWGRLGRETVRIQDLFLSRCCWRLSF